MTMTLTHARTRQSATAVQSVFIDQLTIYEARLYGDLVHNSFPVDPIMSQFNPPYCPLL